MKFKIVNPFVLNQKTYNVGEIVPEKVFLGQEKVQENFLRIGFIQEVSETASPEKAVVAPKVKEVPSMPVKPAATLPKPIEIRNLNDLQKVIENKPVEAPKPPAPAPVVEEKKEEVKEETPTEEKATSTPVQQAPKPRGRVSRT